MSGLVGKKGVLIGIAALLVVIVSPIIMMSGLIALIVSTLFGVGTSQIAATCSSAPVVEAVSVPAGTGSASNAFFSQFSQAIQAEQKKNVGLIKGIGKSLGASTKEIEVAIAVAIQESNLQNLGHQGAKNDHDSLGLYQQRPGLFNADGTPYWGTPEQLVQPEYAIRRFYEELFTFDGYENLSLIAIGIMVQNPNPVAYQQRWAWDNIAKELAAGESGEDVTNGLEAQTVAALDPICESLPITDASLAIETVVNEIGQPYEWNSSTETNGFDGSGLISLAYGKANVALPPVATEQYALTEKVERNELQPGDLVFWATDTNNPESINRVAMWVGDNQIVEAPAAYLRLALTPMHWDGFIGATRPIPEPVVLEAGNSGSSGEWQHPITPGSYSNSSGYGTRQNPLGGEPDFHNGVDLAAPLGTSIYAVADGTVLSFETFGGSGGTVTWIQHSDGIVTGYAHQNKRAGGIAIGTKVKAGDIIGYVGCTGGCTGNHLHLMVVTDWGSGKTVEPVQFMRERGVNL